MRHLIAVAAVVLSSSLAAQGTASLAITGTVNSGQTLAVNVRSNLPGGICALVAGSPNYTLTCQAVVVKFGTSGPPSPMSSVQTAVSNTATLVVGTG